ncbi:MAG: DNA repair protein RecO [Tannerella sp.]|jgi:DNA repair protein RecO (recombination protein O)|nr:DNA repair protein RecO [Tannerella sp.]
MLHKTRGIVFHSIPYNDKYAIVHVFTESFGRVPYMVLRHHGRKTTVARAFFMPLSVLELEVDHLNTREIQSIRETKLCFPMTHIHSHPVKNIIALFLAEVLFRAVHAKEPDTKLFTYLYESIRWLELAEQGIANFHLVFLIHLVRYLGVYPNTTTYQPRYSFDLLNGEFAELSPGHNHFLNETESLIFFRLLRMNYENMAVHSFSRRERTNIMYRILEYYRLHIPDFPEIKSLSVMQSLFD